MKRATAGRYPWEDPSSHFRVAIAKEGQVALSVIDRGFRVLWTNRELERRFARTKGEVCYRVVKQFDRPCAGCPIKQTLEDDTPHSAVVAAPSQVGQTRSLVYSQIVSLPLAQAEDGKPSAVLEVLFDCTREQLAFYERQRRVLAFCDWLRETAFQIPDRYLPYLLLFGAVSEEALDFDEAFLIPQRSLKGDDEETESGARSLAKADSVELTDRYRRAHNMDLTQFCEAVVSRTRILPEGSEEVGDPKIDGNLASRLGGSRIGANLSSDGFGYRGRIVLVLQDESSYILDSRLSDLDIVLWTASTAHRAGRWLTRTREACANAEALFDSCEAEGMLAYAAPFAVGKVHDLDRIHNRIHQAVTLLGHLTESGHGIAAYRRRVLAELGEAMRRLSRTMASMKSVQRMTTPHFHCVELRPLIESVRTSHGTALRQSRIELNLAGVEPGCEVEADEALLFEVFSNLVDNSIRAFGSTKRKPKTILVSAHERGDTVMSEVTDNAGGIAPYVKGLIWRVGFSLRGGTGLGLFFVKHIVEKIHDGAIDVSSVWGEGATFTLMLPKRREKRARQK